MANLVSWFSNQFIFSTACQALRLRFEWDLVFEIDCLNCFLLVASIVFYWLPTLVAKLLSLPPQPPHVNCWHDDLSGELNHLGATYHAFKSRNKIPSFITWCCSPCTVQDPGEDCKGLTLLKSPHPSSNFLRFLQDSLPSMPGIPRCTGPTTGSCWCSRRSRRTQKSRRIPAVSPRNTESPWFKQNVA